MESETSKDSKKESGSTDIVESETSKDSKKESGSTDIVESGASKDSKKKSGSTDKDSEKDSECVWTCVICFWLSHLILSVLLFGLLAFLAGLYILLPINNAFDEAPSRLNGVFSGLVVVFGGFIIYLLTKLWRKKSNKEDSKLLKH